MKNLVLSFLPAMALAATITPRQADNKGGPFGALAELLKSPDGVKTIATLVPKAKVASTQVLEAKVRTGAKRTVTKFGPYTLAGKDAQKPSTKFSKSLDPNGQASVDIISEGLCKNCTILRAKTGLAFADGSSAGPQQGIYLHHIVALDLTKPPNLPLVKCPTQKSPLGQIAQFVAQGDDGLTGSVEFAVPNSQFESGYHMSEDAKILNQVDIVNYNKESKDVYVTFDIEYLEGKVGMDATSTLMSVTPCNPAGGGGGGHAEHGGKAAGINLDTKGAAETVSPDWPILKDGKILMAAAHMHDGGEKMVLYINGKEVCDSLAVYGKGGDNNYETITHNTPCPGAISFKKGDTMKIKSVYDLAKHPLRAGGDHNSAGMADDTSEILPSRVVPELDIGKERSRFPVPY